MGGRANLRAHMTLCYDEWFASVSSKCEGQMGAHKYLLTPFLSVNSPPISRWQLIPPFLGLNFCKQRMSHLSSPFLLTLTHIDTEQMKLIAN